MISIALVDDELILLDAMARLLGMEPGIRVAWAAQDGLDAFDRCSGDPPDVLVTDVEMPRLSGLELARRVRTLPKPPRVLMLTTWSRAGYLRSALDAEAGGYLLKDSPVDDLVSAIRNVAGGRTVVSPALSELLWSSRENPLTPREREILGAAAAGRSNKEIARLFGISPGTVRNRLSDAMGKLDADSRLAASRIAVDNGWLL